MRSAKTKGAPNCVWLQSFRFLCINIQIMWLLQNRGVTKPDVTTVNQLIDLSTCKRMRAPNQTGCWGLLSVSRLCANRMEMNLNRAHRPWQMYRQLLEVFVFALMTTGLKMTKNPSKEDWDRHGALREGREVRKYVCALINRFLRKLGRTSAHPFMREFDL